MRLFIALEVPQNIIDYVQPIQKTLQRKNLFVGTYPKPEQMHITIVFLSEQPKEAIPAIIDCMKQITIPPFNIELGNINLSDQIHPHVIWIDLISDKLEALATTLAQKLNMAEPQRVFKGHLTIARIKKMILLPDLKKTVDSLEKNPLLFTAKNITLYESTLTPLGPVYINRYVQTLT